jgi:hypothetical protein
MADKRLKAAYVQALRANAELLTAWKAALSPERRAQLAAFEGRGLRLGLQLVIPNDAWLINIILLDPAGGIVTLETIELATSGATTTTN